MIFTKKDGKENTLVNFVCVWVYVFRDLSRDPFFNKSGEY